MSDKNITIKTKQPPAMIETAKQAVEALDRMRQYEGMAWRAHARYMHSGMTTQTGQNAYAKYERYREAAESWGDVLRTWLIRQPS